MKLLIIKKVLKKVGWVSAVNNHIEHIFFLLYFFFAERVFKFILESHL